MTATEIQALSHLPYNDFIDATGGTMSGCPLVEAEVYRRLDERKVQRDARAKVEQKIRRELLRRVGRDSEEYPHLKGDSTERIVEFCAEAELLTAAEAHTLSRALLGDGAA